jgi:hypothetical protein
MSGTEIMEMDKRETRVGVRAKLSPLCTKGANTGKLKMEV